MNNIIISQQSHTSSREVCFRRKMACFRSLVLLRGLLLYIKQRRIPSISIAMSIERYLLTKFLSEICLTHLSLASLLWDIGKQNSPRCDASERGVPSAGTHQQLFKTNDVVVIHCYFLLKKCENPLHCEKCSAKDSHIFSTKITVY